MGNIKIVFDSIRAEDKLKASTLNYLKSEMQKQSKTRIRPIRRFAAALVFTAVIIISSISAYNLYFTPLAYVGVDVNPSIEIMLNQFNRVIGVFSYNSDGEYIISELSLKHKTFDEALIMLIDTINEKGYIQNDGLVSVTLQTSEEEKENALLIYIQSNITNYIDERHKDTLIDVFLVSSDTRSNAYELGISTAKYIAIQELIEVDPSATVDSCRNHSISEIRQLAKEHTENHHNGCGHNGTQGGGHHGNGNK